MKTAPRDTRKSRALQPAQDGFTYLWLLFVLAISAAGTAAVGELWVVQVQRSKELDLAFRGQAIVAALESYRAASPAATPCAPLSWEELLQDQRSVTCAGPMPIRLRPTASGNGSRTHRGACWASKATHLQRLW